jgi:hypothetical protein
MTNWQRYVIVACRWPKACDYAGEGFDDVRGQLPRLGFQLQESMMPLLKGSISLQLTENIIF